jgi:threonylcarbamoyladenosine tRNA methylthiotransferase MtaB
MEHILDEVGRLVDRGYREVVLTGIHLGHYGVDWNRNLPKEKWIRLSNLVRHIVALPGDFRIRLSSIEATEVTRELIDVMADHPDKVAPHLHISMQSGSDSVLRRMRRRWGSRRFIDRCRLVQERLDRPAITTDIIVGFPGETDAEFQETIDTARAVGFSKIHIFPFSPRRGTPAATMPSQVPKHVQQERSRKLANIEAELRDAYYYKLLGLRMRVLVESKNDQSKGVKANPWLGTSCRYAIVELNATSDDVGRFVDVAVAGLANGRIKGRR